MWIKQAPDGSKIRLARFDDIQDLLRLEEVCWDSHLRADRDLILTRLGNYPHGQYVAEVNKAVVGILYTQRVSSVEELVAGKFHSQSELHCDDGPVLQLCSIAVHCQTNGNIAAFLRDTALCKARRDRSISKIVAMTRCSRHQVQVKLPLIDAFYHYERWIVSKNDPTIFFHVSGGAQIVEVVNGYREEDTANLGCAVLIQYSAEGPDDGTDDEALSSTSDQSLDAFGNCQLGAMPFNDLPLNLQNLSSEICQQISMINPRTQLSHTMNDTSFLQLIDSMDFQILHCWLEQRLGRTLSPTFLFQYSSPRQVQEFFLRRVESKEETATDSIDDTMKSSSKMHSDHDIAIVGVGCHLPGGVRCLEDLREIQSSKRNTTTHVPFERWNMSSILLEQYLHDKTRHRCVEFGSFLKDISKFNFSSFGITKNEAIEMDPNQRIVLEVIAEAINDYGLDIKSLRGSNTGVWVGVSNVDYPYVGGAGFKDSKTVYGATSSAIAAIAGRVSFCLGLHGPSMVVDTACSSSLVAISQAMTSLRLRQCSMALVSSVNLILSPWISVAYARAGMTSPDGKCHTFDASANGYCRGEGCGAMVLKRLSDALRDGDQIYSVIKGSAVQQDGKSASLTAPNGLAQESLIRAALADAGVEAKDVQYVEAHGTGTPLGDPIETGALAAVYGSSSGRDANHPLYVSSVKANIGHLEAAAGMAGIFSAILSLYYKRSFPNALLNKMNQKVVQTTKGHHLVFPTELAELWRDQDRPLVAGISSFGYTGTIAHIVISEPTPMLQRLIGNACRISAKVAPSLLMECRSRSILWQFSGQGTLSVGSCQTHFDRDAEFRKDIQRCDKILEKCCGLTATDLLYPQASGEFDLESAQRMLKQSKYAQPVQLILQYCLARRQKTQPKAVLGHSLGEFAAAVIAGVMRIEDCIRIVHERGRIMQECAQCFGYMVAVKAARSIVENAIQKVDPNQESVGIAAINGKNSFVISGSPASVDAVLNELSGAPHRRLNVDNAFHSPLMKIAAERFRGVFGRIKLASPKLAYFSSLLGRQTVAGELETADYWVNHILHPVLFYPALKVAWESGIREFVEIGPDSTLSKLTENAKFCSIDKETPIIKTCLGMQFGESDEDYTYLLSEPEYVPFKLPCHRSLECLNARQGDEFAFRVKSNGEEYASLFSCIDLLISAHVLLHVEAISSGSRFIRLSNIKVTSLAEDRPTHVILTTKKDIETVDLFAGATLAPSRKAMLSSGICLCLPELIDSKLQEEFHLELPNDGKIWVDSSNYELRHLACTGFVRNINIAKSKWSVAKLAFPDSLGGYAIHPEICSAVKFHCEMAYSETLNGASFDSCEEVVSKVDLNFRFPSTSQLTIISRCDDVDEDSVPMTTVYVIDDDGQLLTTLSRLRFSSESSQRHPLFLESRLVARAIPDHTRSVCVGASSECLVLWCCTNSNLRDEFSKISKVQSMISVETSLVSTVDVIGDKVTVIAVVLQGCHGATAEFLNDWIGFLEAVLRIRRKVVVFIERYQTINCSLLALLRTASQEYSMSLFKLVQLDSFNDASTSINMLDEILCFTKTSEIVLSGNCRYEVVFETVQLPKGCVHFGGGIYIITGGLGGLGLLTAKCLVEMGVKKLVLVSRSGKVTREGQGLEEDLRWLLEESGCEVRVIRCDVSEEASVVEMLTEVRVMAGEAGIEGVVHAAGVLRDALIRGGGAAAGCEEVWNSKARSAWWLHKHTQGDPIRTFVCYSSITAALGNVGQSAYGAANGYLDGLMEERRRMGLPGLSIQWPAISGVGMAANHFFADNLVMGWKLEANDFQSVFKSSLGISNHRVLPMGLPTYKRIESGNVENLLFCVDNEAPSSPIVDNNTQDISIEYIDEKVTKIVCEILDVEYFDRNQSLMSGGMDSLAATELARLFSKEFDMTLSSTFVFSYPTIGAIVGFLSRHLYGKVPTALPPTGSLSNSSSFNGSDPVAIVGVACRLPNGIRSISELWKLEISKTVVTGAKNSFGGETGIAFEPNISSRMKFGGFLQANDFEDFCGSVLGIGEAEMGAMDANQRILLQVSYEALIDACSSIEKVSGSCTGVFIGASARFSGHSPRPIPCRKLSSYEATSSALSVAAGRISYALGLLGPSVAIDTACSSSLVAIHAARRSLQQRECNMAVVGAIHIIDPEMSISCAVAGMTSPDGKCHTFDASANGYCRGEGCGAMVLKRLSDALRDGDQIYSVIKGSAVQQDGKSASLTAPNGLAQESLIRAALADAGVEAKDVQYVEAHGTGTPLGDPIETGALAAVYGSSSGRDANHPLYVSSVKANIGHLEAAAGMAGIFSAIEAANNRIAPPNANLIQLNPKVHASVEGHCIKFPTIPVVIDSESGILVGISSFGYSGTIAHVIIESFRPPEVQCGDGKSSSQRLLINSSNLSYDLNDVSVALDEATTTFDRENDMFCAYFGMGIQEFLHQKIRIHGASSRLPVLFAYQCIFRAQYGESVTSIGSGLGRIASAVCSGEFLFSQGLSIAHKVGIWLEEASSARIALPAYTLWLALSAMHGCPPFQVMASDREAECILFGPQSLVDFVGQLPSNEIAPDLDRRKELSSIVGVQQDSCLHSAWQEVAIVLGGCGITDPRLWFVEQLAPISSRELQSILEKIAATDEISIVGFDDCLVDLVEATKEEGIID